MLIIFTDLDGTLLDYSNYSFEKALPALEILRQKDIPLVICSSKTRKEIEYYRKKLDNHHPFISENGGGIFIPKGYFEFTAYDSQFTVTDESDYHVIRLGAKYPDLRKAVKELQQEGFDIRGFGDLTIKELMKIVNMSLEETKMSKERDFDEPFIYSGPPHKLPQLLKTINNKGFKFTQGRFYHILGSSNKGIAVSILIDLYKATYGDIKTIAVGDSPNDTPMLERADYSAIVQKSNYSYDPQINIPNLIKAEGIGPKGWNRVILKLISDIT